MSKILKEKPKFNSSEQIAFDNLKMAIDGIDKSGIELEFDVIGKHMQVIFINSQKEMVVKLCKKYK